MKRFAFRRILPTVQLVLWMIFEVSHRFPTDRFDWVTAWRAFEAVNWPAAKLALILNYHLRFAFPALQDLAALFYLLLWGSLILQWYLVGLWVDRRSGLSHRRDLSWPPRVRRGMTWTCLCMAIFCGVLSYGVYLGSHRKFRHLEVWLLYWSVLAIIATLVEVYSAYRRQVGGADRSQGSSPSPPSRR